jgi:putative transposase
MPRKARKKSKSGIYHIIMRGINRQNIFEDDEDNRKFLSILRKYKYISNYEIYAYCLMGNHVHLLLRIKEEPLEQIMRRICSSYVFWYNKKYQRIGNLFQDRFKSEPVDNETYFLVVTRYIHQNPIKAGITKNIEEYKWSSYHEYTGKVNLVDINFILKILNTERKKAIKSFVEYNSKLNNDNCLDIKKSNRITDEDAKNIISELCNVKNAIEIQNFDILTRNKYLKELKEKHDLSIRQIERLTGINRGVVQKA